MLHALISFSHATACQTTSCFSADTQERVTDFPKVTWFYSGRVYSKK